MKVASLLSYFDKQVRDLMTRTCMCCSRVEGRDGAHCGCLSSSRNWDKENSARFPVVGPTGTVDFSSPRLKSNHMKVIIRVPRPLNLLLS